MSLEGAPKRLRSIVTGFEQVKKESAPFLNSIRSFPVEAAIGSLSVPEFSKSDDNADHIVATVAITTFDDSAEKSRTSGKISRFVSSLIALYGKAIKLVLSAYFITLYHTTLFLLTISHFIVLSAANNLERDN